MTARLIDPQRKVAEAFRKFVKETYGDEPFPQFEATEKFFQDYFNTNLKLNDFKNMIGYVKRNGENFELVGQQKNPKTGQNCNYYRFVN